MNSNTTLNITLREIDIVRKGLGVASLGLTLSRDFCLRALKTIEPFAEEDVGAARRALQVMSSYRVSPSQDVSRVAMDQVQTVRDVMAEQLDDSVSPQELAYQRYTTSA